MKKFLQVPLILIYSLLSLGSLAQSGNFLHFDGVDDEIYVPNASQFIAGTNGISMVGWFSIDDLNVGQGYYSLRDNDFGGATADDQMYAVLGVGEALECVYVNNGTLYDHVLPSGSIQSNQWQHVAWIFNGSTISVYINGVLNGSSSANGYFSETNRPFSIGRSIISACCEDEFYFGGKIDEVSLWSKALTPLELQNMMANELIGTEANLELYYKMNQGIACGNNVGITELISEVGGPDRNGNILNFSLNGSTSNFSGIEDPAFTYDDFCENAGVGPVDIITPGGTFTFNVDPADGAVIDPVTGEISNEVVGTAYDVLYTTNGICQNTQVESVTVLDSPIIQDVIFTCSPDQTTYVVTFDIIGGDSTSYSNTGNAGTITGSMLTSDPILSGSVYDITINDANNCGTDNINGTYTCVCDASATLSGDMSICPGTSDSLTISFTGTGPWAFVYAIDLVDQDPISTTDNPYFLTINTVGSYTLSYMFTADCVGPATGEVTVVEVTSSPVIDNVLETCAADQLTYTVTFDIVGGDAATYINTGNTGTFTGNTFTSDPITSGSNYDFTINDFNNCSTDNVNGTFSCPCPAAADISGNINICPGMNGDLTIDFTGPGPWTFDYSIDGNPPITIPPTIDNPYFLSTSIPGTYTLDLMSDANCMGSVSGTATVTEFTSPIISNVVVTCSGDLLTYTVTFDIIGGDAASYVNNGTSQGGVFVGNTFTSSPIASLVPYNFIINDANDCSPAILDGIGDCTCYVTASISGDNVICEGESAQITFDLADEGPDEGPWDLTYAVDGVLEPTITAINTSPYVINVFEPGVYTIDNISTSFCTGTMSGSATIVVNSLPTASINGDFTICAGDEQLIPVELTGSGDWTITYSINGILQPDLITSLPNPFITGTIEGEYLITNVVDNNNCSNSGEGVANLNFLSDIAITFPNNTGICIGESATILADGNDLQTNTFDYIWSTTNLVSVDDSIAIYNPLSDLDVQVTISDGCNSETYDISIVVNELPPVAISGEVNLCGPDFVNLINATPSNYVGGTCLWSVNGDTINNCSNFDYFYDVGTYDVNLQVTSPEGCTNDATFVNQVTILPQATAEFSYSPDNITTSEPEVQFINESSSDVTFLEWNFGDLEVSGEQNPIFIFPVEEGPSNWLTCLYVDNQFGCSDSICEIISIKGDVVLLIPNTFTPDGDAINEFFYPILIGADREDYSFRIYNRYGKIVFETTDIDAKWNGSLQNPDYYAPDGMYSWQIMAKINGSAERKEFLGSVIMIR